jgi:hypothetical protein
VKEREWGGERAGVGRKRHLRYSSSGIILFSSKVMMSGASAPWRIKSLSSGDILICAGEEEGENGGGGAVGGVEPFIFLSCSPLTASKRCLLVTTTAGKSSFCSSWASPPVPVFSTYSVSARV